MKIKLIGKRLNPTDSVKYLAIRIDSKLNWKSHDNAIAAKLNQTNSKLHKVKDFVKANILKPTFFALFESHIKYAYIIRGQNRAKLTVSTFFRIRHLELSVSKSIMLTHFLCFIFLKLSKFQIKSRLRTASS